jgi:hypothetical protein
VRSIDLLRLRGEVDAETQEFAARMLGTSRPTVSVANSQFLHRTPVGLELPILVLIPGLSYVAWRPASDLR